MRVHGCALALSLCIAAGCDDTPSPPDAAPPDAALADAATPDAPAPSDAASPPLDLSQTISDLAPPWGTQALVLFAGDVGLGTDVIDASPDEAHNIWAVSANALYLRRPGDAQFRRYSNADGLHVFSTLTAIAGGAPNEAYVGLEGYIDDNTMDDSLDQKRRGKLEHVHLLPDGTITSLHYADMHNDVSANYYETRSARRLLYAHAGPPAGHLFLGSNHGVTHIFHDGWGDHVHIDVRWMPENAQRLGQYNGLAIDPVTSGLWTCGRVGCGLQNWDPDPRAWVNAKYRYAFSVFTSDHSLQVPHGYEETFTGAAATPDGVAWFLSATEGLASWDPKSHSFFTMTRVHVPALGLPVDIAADPDGTLWIADTDHLLRFDPKSGTSTTLDLPSTGLHRLYLDTTVSPRTLYISTSNGLVLYRGP